MADGVAFPGGSNPFAERAAPAAQPLNPYAAPQAEGAYLQSRAAADPFAGLWRQGNLLVMHRDAPLPDICVKSNQPATRRLKRNLMWHHPAVYLALLLNLIVYAALAIVLRKKATIQIGLSEEWYARRQRRMLLAWGLVLGAVGLFVLAVTMIDRLQDGAPWLFLLALALFLGGAIYGVAACRLVWPKRMTDQYIWLKGVNPAFLDRLEVWEWKI